MLGATFPSGCVCRWQFRARWFAVFAYAYLALGIPLPVPAGLASTEFYPCMNHQCGCRSAEECWHHCCCMSLYDKLAWARDNHITPPDYVLAEAEAHGIQWHAFCLHAYDATESTCSCCSHHGSGCAIDTAGRIDRDSSSAQVHHASQDRGIVLLLALKCSGAGDNWNGLTVSLPPPAEVSLFFASGTVEQVFSLSLRLTEISFPPALPPPRSTVV